jgi:hypothetical protein
LRKQTGHTSEKNDEEAATLNKVNLLTKVKNLKIILKRRGEFNQLSEGIIFNIHYRYYKL